MKRVIKIVLLLLLISLGSTATHKALSQSASVSFSVFYNSLKPYGRWVNNPTYGQVWMSNETGFTPYSTGGHWAYTDYGWTWVSDYDWGWAPFHYGRWAYDPAEGWIWVPGYDWAPAWVAWRSSGDYYGWAPLSPGLNIGVGVSFGNSIPADRWIFAPHRYITSPYINRYYVPRTRNVTIIKNTTIINNVTERNNVHYVAGPRKEEVEKASHTTIRTYNIANASRPGKTVVNNNTINIYKPVVNKTVVNNNNTTVNKNSNNTTVNKNSNNTTVKDKTANNTTVEKNSNEITTTKEARDNRNTTATQNNNNNLQNTPAAPKQATVKNPNENVPAKRANTNNARDANKQQNMQNNKPANNPGRQVQLTPNANAGAKQLPKANKPNIQNKINQNKANKNTQNHPHNTNKKP